MKQKQKNLLGGDLPSSHFEKQKGSLNYAAQGFSEFESNMMMRKGSFDDEDRELLDNINGHLNMNDDLNKINKDFAGDTFSQISSTYENQNGLYNQQSNQEFFTNKPSHPPYKNVSKTSQTKLYQYEEKQKKNTNNDELLDSDILNNSAVNDLQSPNEETGAGNNLNFAQLLNQNSKKHPSNPNKAMIAQNGIIPSPHSNNNLQMIMNSELLQQSTSTMTVYNSGLFDEASIMRILDKTFSADDTEEVTLDEYGHKKGTGNMQNLNNFKFECDDVIQILCSLNQTLKDKLQKCRNNGQQNFTSIGLDELKSLEILSTSGIEKLRLLKKIGVDSFQQIEYKNIKLKQYKENLKIHLHSQIKKYKELCKKQYRQAEHHRFQYQILEYDQNQRIQMLEEKLERQQDDINRQANQCEQIKFQKMTIMKQYDQRMNEMEEQLRMIIRNLQDDSKSAEKLQKVSNSFCIGDHSTLLQPSYENGKRKLINIQSNKQSADDKENESFLSNQNPSAAKLRHSNIKGQLLNLKNMMKDIKKVHQQFNDQQQEGGGSLDFQDSMNNLLGHFFKGHGAADAQQSQIVKPEDSQASVNQAFIQSCVSSQIGQEMIEKEHPNIEFMKSFEKQENKNNTTLEMSFNYNEIVLVDGKRQLQESNQLNDFLKLDGKITENDLKTSNHGFGGNLPGDSQKLVIGSKRDQLMGGGNKNHFKSIGSPDEFNEGSIEYMNSNRHENNALLDKNSMEEEVQILDELYNNQHQKSYFPGDLSMIMTQKLELSGVQHNQAIANQSFHSGGSSLFEFNNALNQYRPKNPNSEYIVIKVNNKEIQMPKLDLKVANKFEKQEYFKNNLQGHAFSSDSSESSYSSIMAPSNHPKEGSFVNESLSKQQITGTQNNIGKGISLIDMSSKESAIGIDALNENIIHTTDNQKSQDESAFIHNMSNMFGDFKKELESSQLKSSQKKSSIKNHPLDQHNDTLDLDLKNEIQEPEQNQGVKIEKKEKQHSKDQSLDLSKSILKKSLSDPNLMFNFNNADEDDDIQQTQEQSKPQHQVKKSINANQEKKSQKNSISSNKPLFDFGKIKTPQGGQIKIKFNRQNSKEHIQNIQMIMQQNKNDDKKPMSKLTQIAAKQRPSNGNSRQQSQQQNDNINGQGEIEKQYLSAQDVPAKVNDPHGQMKKIALKIKRISKFNDMTHIEEQPSHNQDQSVLGKISFIHEPNANQSIMNHDTGDSAGYPLVAEQINEGKKKTKQINKLMNYNQRRDSDHNNKEQHDVSSQLIQPPQLVQNYFSQAQQINNGGNSGNTSIGNISKGKRGFQLRKGHPQMEQERLLLEQDGPVKNQNLMQQYQEYQETYDMVGPKSNRKNKDLSMISPNKNNQRSSQSCTPQKKGIIVVNKEAIKQGERNSVNIAKSNSGEPIPNNQEGQGKVTKIQRLISFKRASNNPLVKQQNMSVLNSSIMDTSQLPSSNQMNISIMHSSHIDNSFIINNDGIQIANIIQKVKGKQVKNIQLQNIQIQQQNIQKQQQQIALNPNKIGGLMKLINNQKQKNINNEGQIATHQEGQNAVISQQQQQIQKKQLVRQRQVLLKNDHSNIIDDM